ncbi:MAG: phosphate acyltransferase PlsX [Pseudopedobacter saltans]|uniref:Phosphate acyltransferase n=1 Tax=Pseudopedobacter saltans TaxID=151895 RepID=A0A2W5FA06_9SPHI|nr:MAG: phosphate acyltransferase PlsX [Pseudopedobacter saltans]
MKIGLDMMGGDYAPLEAVKGLKLYFENNTDPQTVVCVGREEELNSLLSEHGLAGHPQVQIVHAPDVIGFNEHPTKALKEKPKSSISVGFYLLSTGKIDAFASAGSTGAMMVGAMYTLKTIPGILRPTIPTFIPRLDGSTGLLLDVGLNSDCKPEYLNQFAILGSLYVQNMLNIENPSIGLLNVGEEEGKGNNLAQATYPLLKENGHIHFIGNVEGRDFFKSKSHVIVCDGFTGNVILKMAESIYEMAVARKVEKDSFFSSFHYENYGGTPILGVDKPVIIGHGISNDKAFRNIIEQAEKMASSELCEKIEKEFASLAV